MPLARGAFYYRLKVGNPPSVTYPSPNQWLVTVYPITGITNEPQAVITCPGYAFGPKDPFVTQVTFKQVQGMLPINGLTCLIVEVLSSTQFVVQVNTSGFPAYVSGGVICINTGQPVTETVGSQTFNTPFQNIL
jgi:hypothetical protein